MVVGDRWRGWGCGRDRLAIVLVFATQLALGVRVPLRSGVFAAFKKPASLLLAARRPPAVWSEPKQQKTPEKGGAFVLEFALLFVSIRYE